MICPKCDFEQEDRLDCKECGVVFSKYKALFVSKKFSGSPDEEIMLKNDLQDLQIQFKDLSSRFIDIEFEKAERKKIRIELKDLVQQIQEQQQQTESRIQGLEQMLENSVQEFKQQMQESQEQTEAWTKQMDQKFDNFFRESKKQVVPKTSQSLTKSEEIEKKIVELTDSLNHTINQLTSLWEKTGQNSYQITELGTQVAALRNDILETKTQFAKIEKQQVDEEPKTIYQDDVRSIRKNLDELGQFISGLGRK